MKTSHSQTALEQCYQNGKPKFNPITKEIQNIKAIWNNDHQDDNGINSSFVSFFLAVIFPWDLY
jgi:hypothetical protein